jgi:CelD/BcsL family acetyltransferase involved in cellulose biosynthesis
MTLREITDREAFDALEPEWRALEDEGAAPTLFHSWPWQAAWLDHLGRNASLRTLVFMDWRKAVGIAPLVVRRAYGLPLRRLQWIGAGVSDYHGLLVLPGYENAVLRAFAAYLESSARRFWDVADLHQLREGDPLLSPAAFPSRRPDSALRFAPAICRQAVSPYRPLPASLEEFHAQLGKKLRGNLRYAQRALEREHRVEYGLADASDLDREMTCFFDLHARRWRSRWQPGVLFGRAIQAFHRQAARELLERNSLRLHYLRLNGETAASLYCFAYKNVGYYYLGGFDPAWSKWSVGTLLTARAMESALREGCAEFDFLRGQEPYKYRWGCLDRVNYRMVSPGRGTFAACAPRFLSWEQRVADYYEARAHGGAGHGSTA